MWWNFCRINVILYIKESIQANKIKLEREADCDGAVSCNIVKFNINHRIFHRSTNINDEGKKITQRYKRSE